MANLLGINVDHLKSLRSQKRWMLWKKVLTKDGRSTKVPKRLDGTNASSTDPDSWATFKQLMPIPEGMAGIGIALGGGLVGIDMDACIVDGQIEPWANEVLEHLSTYAEVSPSGAGIKLLVKVEEPQTPSASVKWGEPVTMPDGSTKHRELAVFYSGRYFTVTEKIWCDTPIRSVTAQDLEWVMKRIKAIKSAKHSPANPKLVSSQPGNALALPDALKKLPAELRLLIEQGVPEGTRSEQFHRAVGWLKGKGEMSVRELARVVERDVKRVHDDIVVLAELGLLERTEGGGVTCPYTSMHIDMYLQAA